MMKIYDAYFKRHERAQVDDSLQGYLELCKHDLHDKATAAARMWTALGEPALLSTGSDPRLSGLEERKQVFYQLGPAVGEADGCMMDRYSVISFYAVGQCLADHRQMEFIERSKAPIKVHDLLKAAQEDNKNNEAFLDRVYFVKVPYHLSAQKKIKIEKNLFSSPEIEQRYMSTDYSGSTREDGQNIFERYVKFAAYTYTIRPPPDLSQQ